MPIIIGYCYARKHSGIPASPSRVRGTPKGSVSLFVCASLSPEYTHDVFARAYLSPEYTHDVFARAFRLVRFSIKMRIHRLTVSM